MHPLDEAGLVLQVGDDAGHVRQFREGREGRPALVVDEDQGQVLGRVRGDEGEDQGPQEFRLARTGGADAQAVRAHAQLRGLLEVQQHRFARVVDADGHAEEGPFGARGPQAGQIQVRHVVDAEQSGEVDGPRQRGVHQRFGRQAQRCEHPGQALGERGAHLVGAAVGADGLLLAEVLDDHLVALDGDPDGHLARFLDPFLQEVQDGDAHLAQPDRLVGARQLHRVLPVAVRDDDQPRRHGQGVPAGQTAPHLGRVGGAAAQLRAELPGELRCRRGDTACGDRSVELFGVEEVGQPLGPLPVGDPVAGHGERQRHVVGGVGGRRLDEQRAGHPEAVLAGADDADVAHPVERDGQGEFGAGPEAVHQRRRLVEHEEVGRCEHRRALVGDPQLAYGHLPGADPHPQEVGVGTAALPQPGGVAHEVVQGVRGRVEDVGPLPSCAFLGGQLLAQVLDVGEVGLPLGAPGALGLAALGEEEGDGAEDRDDEDDRAEARELAVADDRHHDDGGHDACHGQQRHRDVARLPLGEVRRCLDGAWLGSGRWPGRPGRAVYQSGAHRRSSLIVVRHSSSVRWRSRL